MLTVKRTYTRPSTDISWHAEILPGTEFIKQLQTYRDNGKYLKHEVTFSEDGLTMFYRGEWISREAFDEYDTDPILVSYWNLKDEYYSAVGVITGPKEFE
jgi:hypothetical protein